MKDEIDKSEKIISNESLLSNTTTNEQTATLIFDNGTNCLQFHLRPDIINTSKF
jgi:hypothetical protein